MRTDIIRTLRSNGIEVCYWAERDAADKVAVFQADGFCEKWEMLPANPWGARHVLQIIAGLDETQAIMLNLFVGGTFAGTRSDVFMIHYSGGHGEVVQTLPLPDSEDDHQKLITTLLARCREKNAPPRKRRGRPVDPRIAAQQRNRVRLFLAELEAGKSKEEATWAVVDRYGVDRRTIARDRKAHEFGEKHPPALAYVVALTVYAMFKGWRLPPRYLLQPGALTQYEGETTGAGMALNQLN